ncbi:MAG: hypothetical protein DRG11_03605 [Epsilonproteobacteria bacterium]|nr:MAG: hypothetical protein DRG11_03605 [Campylobacterota bacterium]
MGIDDGFLDDDRLDNISLDDENDSQFRFRQYKKYVSTIIIALLLTIIAIMYFSQNTQKIEPSNPIEVGEKLDKIDTNDKLDETTIDDELFTKDKADTVDRPEVDDKTNIDDIPDNSALGEETKPKGVYIQVGAFTTYPAKKVSNDIEKQGYKVVIYKKNINGIEYFKVLVGPYESEQKARDDVESVKTKLNIKGVFIFK